MKRLRKILLVLLVLAILAVGVYLAYSQYAAAQAAAAANAAQSRITYATVQRGSLQATVNTTGSIVPVTQVKIGFRASGVLKEVRVKVGDVVKEGDVLAKLDTSELELALATAQINLDNAQIKYQQALAGPKSEDITIAKANLEKARANLQKAQSDYDRIAWMAGAGASSQALALQQATLDYQIAVANYAKATAGSSQQDLAQLQNAVKLAEIQVETARRNLNNAIIVAPVSGIIASVGANVGEYVGSGVTMFTIVNLQNLRVDANVDETDVAKLAVGQPAVITFDSLPGLSLKGRVIAISPNATVQSGVVTYQVQIGIDDKDPRLRGGLTATANIIVEQKDNVLMVPNRAIRVNRNIRSVLVTTNEGLVEKQIQTGMANDQYTEVIAGLNEGDKVAIITTATNQPLSGGITGGTQFRMPVMPGMGFVPR